MNRSLTSVARASRSTATSGVPRCPKPPDCSRGPRAVVPAVAVPRTTVGHRRKPIVQRNAAGWAQYTCVEPSQEAVRDRSGSLGHDRCPAAYGCGVKAETATLGPRRRQRYRVALDGKHRTRVATTAAVDSVRDEPAQAGGRNRRKLEANFPVQAPGGGSARPAPPPTAPTQASQAATTQRGLTADQVARECPSSVDESTEVGAVPRGNAVVRNRTSVRVQHGSTRWGTGPQACAGLLSSSIS
jgi:hypothetical protein